MLLRYKFLIMETERTDPMHPIGLRLSLAEAHAQSGICSLVFHLAAVTDLPEVNHIYVFQLSGYHATDVPNVMAHTL